MRALSPAERVRAGRNLLLIVGTLIVVAYPVVTRNYAFAHRMVEVGSIAGIVMGAYWATRPGHRRAAIFFAIFGLSALLSERFYGRELGEVFVLAAFAFLIAAMRAY